MNRKVVERDLQDRRGQMVKDAQVWLEIQAGRTKQYKQQLLREEMGESQRYYPFYHLFHHSGIFGPWAQPFLGQAQLSELRLGYKQYKKYRFFFSFLFLFFF